MIIRQAKSAEDWRRIREICCLTGRAGEAIPRERWSFFGEHWIGPYQKLVPEWAYVAESGGQIAGYLTGCPDTRAFNQQRRLRFTLPLLLKTAAGAWGKTSDTRRFIRRALGLDPSPEQSFPREAREEVLRLYPAHLHTNLDAAYRGSGIGRALVGQYFDDLKKAGIAGVHLHCGSKPVPFYRKVGFAEFSSREFSPGVHVYIMTARL